jgi:hypothetical protein
MNGAPEVWVGFRYRPPGVPEVWFRFGVGPPAVLEPKEGFSVTFS